ncbi:TonB-dependent receptor domain-containing protein [Horticoccus sp. 23ND18S-11]|uniref:TonB-dependent receptor domain-containing protein n=1 Tax=Horticoccus sp. 23ND18S-11 TaxID=3391832 RepID=UPI0039C8D864
MRYQTPVSALLAITLAAAASAQSVTPPKAPATGGEQPVQLEAFTVTGSNIRRVDAETALPVTVIEKTDLDARGAATMAELFETLGAAEISGITEINNGPQLARGDVASIDLRGIGSGSTLTLLNGRRMAPHPISMAENGVPSLAVNINTIPRALVERVEILRDGASAIYGSDAAAGVINNYVSRTFMGRGVTLKGSMTQHGGANEFNATAFEGFKVGKTHLSVSLDYFHRDALSAHDRDFAKNADLRVNRALPAPWNGIPVVDPATGAVFARDNDFRNANSVNQWGQWQRGAIQSDYLTFVGARPAGNTGITTSTTPPAGVATMAADGMFYLWPSAAGVMFKQTAPSTNIDNPENAAYSNWNKWKMLLPATDRVQFATFFDRPINDKLSAFGDLLFYRAYSRTGREPVNFKNTDDQGIYLPAANPWNPFGVRFYHPTGQPNADGTQRLVGAPADVSLWTGISPGQNTGDGFKPRETEVYSYAWRVLSGLRGRIGATWEWESAVVASGAQTHEYEHFQVRESFLRRALNRTDATAFNPFPVTFKIANNQIVVDQLFTNPTSVLDGIYGDEDRFGRTGLYMWDLKVNGRIGRFFTGGDIGIAAGTEVRYESYSDGRASYVGVNPPGSGSQFPLLREGDNDFLALSSNVPIDAHQTIYAAYAETALPFVTRENRIPFVNSLELSLAGRFEHFSIHGQTTKPKASLVWKPAAWLKLRASAAESFRAPNLVQTNITPLRRQISADDPYRFEVTALRSDGTAQRTVFRQGNQNLQPEEAKTWVAGFVLEVPKVRGLSVSFDYFKLNQNSVIENVGAAAAIDRDEVLLDLATQAELAKGTPIDSIDLGSGSAAYKGSSKIVRKAVTAEDRAAFAAYNARQTSNNSRRAAVGEFVSVIDDYLNLSGRDIQGYEFGIQWRGPKTRLGQFSFSSEATHYVLRRSKADESSPILDELGRNGRVKWRANSSVSWRQGPVSAGWFANYFGSTVDTSAATTEAIYRALGSPEYIRVFNDNGITRYLLNVDPMITHNAWISYRFDKDARPWLKGVSVRGGINNVFDTDPQLADEQYGYISGSANPRGRQFTMEVSKRF